MHADVFDRIEMSEATRDIEGFVFMVMPTWSEMLIDNMFYAGVQFPLESSVDINITAVCESCLSGTQQIAWNPKFEFPDFFVNRTAPCDYYYKQVHKLYPANRLRRQKSKQYRTFKQLGPKLHI
jgi:hypothetical protein